MIRKVYNSDQRFYDFDMMNEKCQDIYEALALQVDQHPT